MNKTLLQTVALCLTFIATRCPAADDSAEKMISREFTVQPGGEINVDADQGDIEINTGSQNNVKVVVERAVTGGSDSQATALLKAHKVTFSQTEKSVRVQAMNPKQSHGLFSHPNLSLSVHFLITVPERFDAVLNTAGGNIRISDLNGAVDARTSGGDLTLAKIRGVIDAHTSGGNIKSVGCTDKLQVHTSGGNILVKDFSGPVAQVDTSGGNIEINDCAGKLQSKTSGGNITIKNFSGPAAFADTSGGTVSLDLTKQPEGDCWLRTSGGNITAIVPALITMNVNAETSGGEVSSELPVTVQGKLRPGKLEGKINGGGPNFILKTSGGDIDIKIRKE